MNAYYFRKYKIAVLGAIKAQLPFSGGKYQLLFSWYEIPFPTIFYFLFPYNFPITSTPPCEFHLNSVTVDFVQNALRSLKTNKAVGLDKLSARLLKDASDVIAPVLTELIKSFADGEFPKVWKSAKVSALFKGGDKSQKDNYRPISILPIS